LAAWSQRNWRRSDQWFVAWSYSGREVTKVAVVRAANYAAGKLLRSLLIQQR
jgi:hypothetical protein